MDLLDSNIITDLVLQMRQAIHFFQTDCPKWFVYCGNCGSQNLLSELDNLEPCQ